MQFSALVTRTSTATTGPSIICCAKRFAGNTAIQLRTEMIWTIRKARLLLLFVNQLAVTTNLNFGRYLKTMSPVIRFSPELTNSIPITPLHSYSPRKIRKFRLFYNLFQPARCRFWRNPALQRYICRPMTMTSQRSNI